MRSRSKPWRESCDEIKHAPAPCAWCVAGQKRADRLDGRLLMALDWPSGDEFVVEVISWNVAD